MGGGGALLPPPPTPPAGAAAAAGGPRGGGTTDGAADAEEEVEAEAEAEEEAEDEEEEGRGAPEVELELEELEPDCPTAAAAWPLLALEGAARWSMPSLCWASRRANDKDGLLTRMDRACSGLCCHRRVRVVRGVCMVVGGGG